MPRGKNHIYDMEVVDYIKANVKGHIAPELVEMVKRDLGKDIDTHEVYLIRQYFKLNCGVDCRFKKGLTSWNKGKKGYMGANRTSFKKGQKPPNLKQIGEEQIQKDGYIFIKVNDKPNARQDNWMPKQQYIYEQYHNVKVPEKSVVIFADGNYRNFDIDNLVMVTRSELLYLNQHHLIYNDAELTKTGVLIAKVSRAASERGNKKKEGKK